MKLVANNTFQDGLVMDFHPSLTKNTCLTDALNATLLTYNGNELQLQNDMGNGRVETAFLPEGYVPLGTCSLGGIIYIASYNPLTNKGLIGSFPSPERNIDSLDYNLSDIIQFDLNNKLISEPYTIKFDLIAGPPVNLDTPIARAASSGTVISPIIPDTGSKNFYNLLLYSYKEAFKEAVINPGDLYAIYGNISEDERNNILTDKNIFIDDNESYTYDGYINVYPIILFESGKSKQLNCTNLIKKDEGIDKKDDELIDVYRKRVSTDLDVVNTNSNGKLGLEFSVDAITSFNVSYSVIDPASVSEEERTPYPIINLDIRWNKEDCPASILICIKDENGTDHNEIISIDKLNINNNYLLYKITRDSKHSFINTFENLAKSNSIYTIKITPSVSNKDNILIPWLKNSFSIDFSLEGTGDISLDKWQYFTNFNNDNPTGINLLCSISGIPYSYNPVTNIKLLILKFDESIAAQLLEIDNLGYSLATYHKNTLYLANILYELVLENSRYTGQFADTREHYFNITDTLEKDSLYFCKLIVNFSNNLQKAFYRLMYTTGFWNNEYGITSDFDTLSLDLKTTNSVDLNNINITVIKQDKIYIPKVIHTDNSNEIPVHTQLNFSDSKSTLKILTSINGIVTELFGFDYDENVSVTALLNLHNNDTKSYNISGKLKKINDKELNLTFDNFYQDLSFTISNNYINSLSILEFIKFCDNNRGPAYTELNRWFHVFSPHKFNIDTTTSNIDYQSIYSLHRSEKENNYYYYKNTNVNWEYTDSEVNLKTRVTMHSNIDYGSSLFVVLYGKLDSKSMESIDINDPKYNEIYSYPCKVDENFRLQPDTYNYCFLRLPVKGIDNSIRHNYTIMIPKSFSFGENTTAYVKDSINVDYNQFNNYKIVESIINKNIELYIAVSLQGNLKTTLTNIKIKGVSVKGFNRIKNLMVNPNSILIEDIVKKDNLTLIAELDTKDVAVAKIDSTFKTFDYEQLLKVYVLIHDSFNDGINNKDIYRMLFNNHIIKEGNNIYYQLQGDYDSTLESLFGGNGIYIGNDTLIYCIPVMDITLKEYNY